MTSAASRAAAKRIEFLLRTFLIVCTEIFTALFMCCIGMYLSSEFQFGSRIAFRLGPCRSSMSPSFSVRTLPLRGNDAVLAITDVNTLSSEKPRVKGPDAGSKHCQRCPYDR